MRFTYTLYFTTVNGTLNTVERRITTTWYHFTRMFAVCVGRLLSYRIYILYEKKFFFTQIPRKLWTLLSIMFIRISVFLNILPSNIRKRTQTGRIMEKREELLKFTCIFRYCQLNFNLIPIKGLKSKHWIWDQRTGKRLA